MSNISVYRGSELNRLARKFVDQKSRELKSQGQKASFSDWELVINEDLPAPALRVRYGIYEIRRKTYIDGVFQPHVKLGIEFGNITL
jgi:hypothetical protein